MDKFCVFAGTTEGRELVEFLLEQGAAVTACVATEYGRTLLPEGAERLTVSARRLSGEEMAALLKLEKFTLTIDATHPYAQVVTEEIAGAAHRPGIHTSGSCGRAAEEMRCISRISRRRRNTSPVRREISC